MSDESSVTEARLEEAKKANRTAKNAFIVSIIAMLVAFASVYYTRKLANDSQIQTAIRNSIKITASFYFG